MTAQPDPEDQPALFRQQAVLHRRDTWLGAISVTQPLSFTSFSIGILGAALILLAFLYFGEYTKKARAQGYVVPDRGVIKLYPSQSGTIVSVNAREGERVEKGDLLAVISLEKVGVEGPVQEQISRQIDSRRRSLARERAKIHAINQEQLRHLAQRLDFLLKEQGQIAATKDAYAQRSRLADAAVARSEQLIAMNFVSEASLGDKAAEAAEHRAKYHEAERAQSINEREIAALRAELKNFPAKSENELAALDRMSAELAGTALESEAKREYHLLAPQSGIATANQAERGKQANPALPLLSIVPSDAKMQIELYVSSRAVGFVKVGNKARLHYRAYPFQKFGSHNGTVTKISRTAVLASEVALPAPTNEAFYVVTVEPAQDHVLAYGRREKLQAGMQTEADILLDRRSILEWMFEPLFSVSGRL